MQGQHQYLPKCVCMHNFLFPLHTASPACRKGSYVFASYFILPGRKASHINKMVNVLIPLVA